MCTGNTVVASGAIHLPGVPLRGCDGCGRQVHHWTCWFVWSVSMFVLFCVLLCTQTHLNTMLTFHIGLKSFPGHLNPHPGEEQRRLGRAAGLGVGRSEMGQGSYRTWMGWVCTFTIGLCIQRPALKNQQLRSWAGEGAPKPRRQEKLMLADYGTHT